MVYSINGDSCISCGACAAECPVEAINQGDSFYAIDESVCTGCGKCSEVCPVACISEKK
ncbi:MAG TPA: 4Fe-4S binding protein [bacterium]|nr:4Fe-4S binding protein [bacterium]HPS31152.1 4Fe-4S binding protein [bacterium]